jgi:hypothetical protein
MTRYRLKQRSLVNILIVVDVLRNHLQARWHRGAAGRRQARAMTDRARRPLVLALALIAAAPLATNAQTTEPRSCQQLHEEMSKCETGMRSCDQHVIARLQAQCQRDEKRLPQVMVPRDGGRP